MPNYEFLRTVLGDELFTQFASKMESATGINLVNASDGTYIPKSKFDDEHNKVKALNATIAELNTKLSSAQAQNNDIDALNQKINQLTADIADRDAKISTLGLNYRVKDALRGFNAKNVDVLMPLLHMDKISEQDGKLIGLQEQVDAIKKSDAYLFSDAPGTKGGFGGGQDVGGSFNINEAMNNAIRGSHG